MFRPHEYWGKFFCGNRCPNELKRETWPVDQRKSGFIFGNGGAIHFIPVHPFLDMRTHDRIMMRWCVGHAVHTWHLPQPAPSKTASKLGSLGAQNPQGHYLSGPTIDFESIAVHKYAKICDCHTKGGRGAGAARANFCIIITPPTKFFAITLPPQSTTPPPILMVIS